MILYSPDPGTNADALGEADLDIECVRSSRPERKDHLSLFDRCHCAVQYAISQNLAPVISLSFGACEAEAT